MITALIIGLVVWAIVIAMLLTPNRAYTRMFDRLTHAKWRNDRTVLQIMLDNLRTSPEEWSFSRDAASYPLEGAKQIYLNYDKTEGWTYSLANFGSESRPLDGHFGSLFAKELVELNTKRESQSLLRSMYGIDSTLLLK